MQWKSQNLIDISDNYESLNHLNVGMPKSNFLCGSQKGEGAPKKSINTYCDYKKEEDTPKKYFNTYHLQVLVNDLF